MAKVGSIEEFSFRVEIISVSLLSLHTNTHTHAYKDEQHPKGCLCSCLPFVVASSLAPGEVSVLGGPLFPCLHLHSFSSTFIAFGKRPSENFIWTCAASQNVHRYLAVVWDLDGWMDGWMTDSLPPKGQVYIYSACLFVCVCCKWIIKHFFPHSSLHWNHMYEYCAHPGTHSQSAKSPSTFTYCFSIAFVSSSSSCFHIILWSFLLVACLFNLSHLSFYFWAFSQIVSFLM